MVYTAISSADDENGWTGEKVALITWVDSLSSLADNPNEAEKFSLVTFFSVILRLGEDWNALSGLRTMSTEPHCDLQFRQSSYQPELALGIYIAFG